MKPGNNTLPRASITRSAGGGTDSAHSERDDPSILHVNPAIPKDSAVLIHRDEGTVLDAERLHDMSPIVCYTSQSR
jgi:hypothetical protein